MSFTSPIVKILLRRQPSQKASEILSRLNFQLVIISPLPLCVVLTVYYCGITVKFYHK